MMRVRQGSTFIDFQQSGIETCRVWSQDGKAKRPAATGLAFICGPRPNLAGVALKGLGPTSLAIYKMVYPA